MNQLIRCKNCDELFMKTPFDHWPEYEFGSNHPDESIQVIEKDDYQDFLIHHHGHQLENLRVIEDSFVSEKAYSEPIKTSYFKATNGKESFVIKKFRERIDEPLKYQLIDGDYFLKWIALHVQTDEIVKQLKKDFKDNLLTQDQIDAFVKLYHQIVESLDVKNLERVPEESPNPLEIFYKMDDVSLFYLLRNCRHIFNKQEHLRIEDFIHRHREDGVLLLRATYKIQIKERAKSKKKPIPESVFLEKKKVLKKE
jgi:hypothetical protein